MSRNTRAASVPYKINIGKPSGEICKALSNWQDGGENKAIKGWVGVAWSWGIKKTKQGTLWADAVTKNPENPHQGDVVLKNISVFIVNESEWQAGGAEDYSFFSFDKEVIQEFMTDFNLKGEIEENTVVMQTL